MNKKLEDLLDNIRESYTATNEIELYRYLYDNPLYVVRGFTGRKFKYSSFLIRSTLKDTLLVFSDENEIAKESNLFKNKEIHQVNFKELMDIIYTYGFDEIVIDFSNEKTFSIKKTFLVYILELFYDNIAGEFYQRGMIKRYHKSHGELLVDVLSRDYLYTTLKNNSLYIENRTLKIYDNLFYYKQYYIPESKKNNDSSLEVLQKKPIALLKTLVNEYDLLKLDIDKVVFNNIIEFSLDNVRYIYNEMLTNYYTSQVAYVIENNLFNTQLITKQTITENKHHIYLLFQDIFNTPYFYFLYNEENKKELVTKNDKNYFYVFTNENLTTEYKIKYKKQFENEPKFYTKFLKTTISSVTNSFKNNNIDYIVINDYFIFELELFLELTNQYLAYSDYDVDELYKIK